jgi:thioredoxin 1
MGPILAELKQEYAGQMIVEFYHVSENPEIAREYGIRAIPTVIYYNDHGLELARQEGFVPRKDIVAPGNQDGGNL